MRHLDQDCQYPGCVMPNKTVEHITQEENEDYVYSMTGDDFPPGLAGRLYKAADTQSRIKEAVDKAHKLLKEEGLGRWHHHQCLLADRAHPGNCVVPPSDEYEDALLAASIGLPEGISVDDAYVQGFTDGEQSEKQNRKTSGIHLSKKKFSDFYISFHDAASDAHAFAFLYESRNTPDSNHTKEFYDCQHKTCIERQKFIDKLQKKLEKMNG